MKFVLIALFATAASAMIAPLNTVKERIEGSYIVVFHDGVDTLASISTIENSPFFKSLGGRIDRVYQHALNGFAGTMSSKAVELIRRFDFVKYIEEDQVVRIASVASWGLDRIDQRAVDLDGVYDPKGTGASVNVYVIDTGIRTTHVDFDGRADKCPTDFTNPLRADKYNEDCNGHGTHCAGTVGGRTYGVAKNVNLIGVKVLSCLGSGSTSGVVGGMDWVTSDHDAPAVASMSLGGGGSLSIDRAARNMHEAGVTVVVAAGNSNEDCANSSPAREPLAITVGATASDDTRASYSNFGELVDIFAPGSSITSAWIDSDTDANTISGTSMATPHVAGAAAILLSANNNLKPADVADELVASASAVVESVPAGTTNKLLFIGNE